MDAEGFIVDCDGRGEERGDYSIIRVKSILLSETMSKLRAEHGCVGFVAHKHSIVYSRCLFPPSGLWQLPWEAEESVFQQSNQRMRVF